MTLTDQEVRHFGIELLTAATDRDLQTTIGASNLANGCSYCLACAIVGISRDTPATDRAYLGRVFGTALHGIFEDRINQSKADLARFDEESDELDEKGERFRLSQIGTIARRFPGILSELKITLGELGAYGRVGSTVDVVIPSHRHGIDWKGSTRAKILILQDWLAIERGLPAPFGRSHKEIKLSEREYAKELLKVAYKVAGYYAQTQEYADGLNKMGIPIERFSLYFVARDGTGWFDNPTQPDYDHPSRVHDTFVLSYDYNPAAAAAVWNRGLDIFEQLDAGFTPADFPSHELCFPCGLDRKNGGEVEAPAPRVEIPAVLTSTPAQRVAAAFAPVVKEIEAPAPILVGGPAPSIWETAPPERVAVDGLYPALVS